MKLGQRVLIKETGQEGIIKGIVLDKVSHVQLDDGQIIETLDKTITLIEKVKMIVKILEPLWRWVRSLFILLVIFSGTLQAQTRLNQIERSATKWRVPATTRLMSGTFAMEYHPLQTIIDSSGITIGGGTDSIFLNSTKDSIFLRDGDGFVLVSDLIQYDSLIVRNDSLFLFRGGGGVFIGNNGAFWNLNGNTLTSERYLGTNSAHDLPIRLNSLERFRLTQAGRLDFSNPLNNVFIEGGNENVTGDLNFTMGGLINLTSGSQNTTMGLGSGRNLTTQGQNTLIGFNAGENLRSTGHTAIGINALRGPAGGGTTTSNQVAIGNFVLENHSGAGIGNVIIAPNAFRTGNPSGITAMGTGLSSSGTGLYNSIFGAFAAGNYTTSTRLSTFGALSGIGQVTASGGTFFGYAAGRYEDEGDRLMIDAIDRGNKANGRANSIIYGVMNSNRANQILDLNAKVKPAIMGGTAVNLAGYDSDGYLTTASFTPPADVTINGGNAINVAGSNPYTVSYTGQDSTTVSDTPTLDLTLTGNNITGAVDTSIIATKYHVSTQIQPTDLSFSGGSGTVNLNSSTGNDVTIVSGVGTSPTLSSGNLLIDLVGNSAALHNMTTTGVMVRTGSATYATRSLISGTGINISNPDGVGGNPTITNTGVTSINSSTGNISMELFRTGTNLNNLSLAPGNTVTGALVPTGGTVGQVVKKFSSTAGDYGWGADLDQQILGISGNILSISNGNSVTLPTGTDSQTLSAGGTSNRNISISGGNTLNTVLVPNGGTTSQVLKKSSNTSGDYNWAADSDNQTLSLVGTTLSISGGNSVSLPAGSNQLLTFLTEGSLGVPLEISGGNTANFRDGLGVDVVRTASNVTQFNLSQPFGFLNRNTEYTISSVTTTGTRIDFTQFNNNGLSASSTTDQITIPSGYAGVYEIEWGGDYAVNGESNIEFQLFINSSNANGTRSRAFINAPSNTYRKTIFSLNAGDVLELRAVCIAGSGVICPLNNAMTINNFSFTVKKIQ